MVKDYLKRMRSRRWVFPEGAKTLVAYAIVIGVLAGAANIVFRWMIDVVQHLAYGVGAAGDIAAPRLAWWRYIFMPALGALVTAPFLILYASEAKGHGVPSVLKALAVHGGMIRGRVSFVKTITSAICIGSGGSAGREGPIIQIGASIGSALSRLSGLSKEHVRTLVAAGAAAGISATFNAPIAGVLFAAEVLFNRRHVNLFPILIASVFAAVVSRWYFGPYPSFQIPFDYRLASVYEFGFYFALGIGGGLLSVLFMRALDRAEVMFQEWYVHDVVRLVTGGLATGLIGVAFPHVLGSNYHTVEAALELQADFTAQAFLVFAALALVKIFATCCTLGSGNSGGVFAPSLFIGATFGAAFGMLAHRIAPHLTAAPANYALVGMAAMVSGCARAPLTAIIIIFEMTDSYEIILPLMLTAGTSLIVSSHFIGDSIYTMRLTREGLKSYLSPDTGLLAGMAVSDAMRRDVASVEPGMLLIDVVRRMREQNSDELPMTDSDGNLRGVVILDDIREILFDESLSLTLVAADVAVPAAMVAPEESLLNAMVEMEEANHHVMVVVPAAGRVPIGILRPEDILRAYEHAILPGFDHPERKL